MEKWKTKFNGQGSKYLNVSLLALNTLLKNCKYRDKRISQELRAGKRCLLAIRPVK